MHLRVYVAPACTLPTSFTSRTQEAANTAAHLLHASTLFLHANLLGLDLLKVLVLRRAARESESDCTLAYLLTAVPSPCKPGAAARRRLRTYLAVEIGPNPVRHCSESAPGDCLSRIPQVANQYQPDKPRPGADVWGAAVNDSRHCGVEMLKRCGKTAVAAPMLTEGPCTSQWAMHLPLCGPVACVWEVLSTIPQARLGRRQELRTAAAVNTAVLQRLERDTLDRYVVGGKAVDDCGAYRLA